MKGSSSHATSSVPCTVAILTFNSGRTVRKTLESVAEFGQIIVCDGGSTDDTLTIAKEFDAHVIHQDLKFKNQNGSIADFSGIRNQTLDAATHDWFMFVDSDEYLSPESVEEIAGIVSQAIQSNTPLAYWMPRKRVYQGVVVECATTYPSFQMRFFNKRGVTRFIKAVHERIELLPGTTVGYLKEYEYVPFDFSYPEWKKKLSYYIGIEVARHADQSFTSWLQMVFNSFKASILYALRYVKISLFCRGQKMPFWYELMQHWYHWHLITKTGAKFFTFK